MKDSGHAMGQGHGSLEAAILTLNFRLDEPFGMRQPGPYLSQGAELGGDDDGLETGRTRADAQERGEAVIQGVRAPGVAVRTAGLRMFQGGLETEAFHPKPQPHPVEEYVHTSEEAQGLKEVVREVDGGAVQLGVGEKRCA